MRVPDRRWEQSWGRVATWQDTEVTKVSNARKNPRKSRETDVDRLNPSKALDFADRPPFLSHFWEETELMVGGRGGGGEQDSRDQSDAKEREENHPRT